MPLPKNDFYTIADIYALPDGKRAELIDGHIYDMAPPSPFHQELVMELSATIRDYIKKNKGNCKEYIAPFAVFLNQDEYNYVEPDISVICDLNKINDKGCNGAPDFVIEVVSPSSQRMDYLTKLLNIAQPVLENIGLLTHSDVRFRCILLKDQKILFSMHLKMKFQLRFIKI